MKTHQWQTGGEWILRAQRGRAAALALPGCLMLIAAAANTPGPSFLDQGWSEADRLSFYTTSQGSELIPYSWFMALERPDSQDLFSADSLTRFGYLPNPTSPANPDGLPVGFVLTREGQNRYLGMTCAACHTGQITDQGSTIQIDGAPASADLWAFLAELRLAVARTSADDVTFERFTQRVNRGNGTPAQNLDLRDKLHQYSDHFATFLEHSAPMYPWGPARADAFGMIFDRVASFDLDLPNNDQPANAPVSYPCLWDTTWHNRVQWDSSVPNQLGLERLARNVGEALGVFARIDLRKGLPYYDSSINRPGLEALENAVSRLRSPRWPEGVLGPIDPDKAQKGKQIYGSLCAHCHPVIERGLPAPHSQITYRTLVSEIGTDDAMASMGATRTVNPGRLAGAKQLLLFGNPLRNPDLATNLVNNAVAGAIAGTYISHPHPASATEALRSAPVSGAGRQPLTVTKPTWVNKQFRQWVLSVANRSSRQKAIFYKARPLDGIWATAPYLHNGSVPSLYQLLLPDNQRTVRFYVGSREFDPVNVGFKTDPFPGGFELDTTRAGSRNTGHTGPMYGTDLTDQERWQLVEYLKTL